MRFPAYMALISWVLRRVSTSAPIMPRYISLSALPTTLKPHVRPLFVPIHDRAKPTPTTRLLALQEQGGLPMNLRIEAVPVKDKTMWRGVNRVERNGVRQKNKVGGKVVWEDGKKGGLAWALRER
jgi:hypothetical protein